MISDSETFQFDKSKSTNTISLSESTFYLTNSQTQSHPQQNLMNHTYLSYKIIRKQNQKNTTIIICIVVVAAIILVVIFIICKKNEQFNC